MKLSEEEIRQKHDEAKLYRGVSYDKGHDRFRAKIEAKRWTMRSLRTKTAKEAAKLYDAMAIGHFSDKAILNFPEDS